MKPVFQRRPRLRWEERIHRDVDAVIEEREPEPVEYYRARFGTNLIRMRHRLDAWRRLERARRDGLL